MAGSNVSIFTKFSPFASLSLSLSHLRSLHHQKVSLLRRNPQNQLQSRQRRSQLLREEEEVEKEGREGKLEEGKGKEELAAKMTLLILRNSPYRWVNSGVGMNLITHKPLAFLCTTGYKTRG